MLSEKKCRTFSCLFSLNKAKKILSKSARKENTPASPGGSLVGKERRFRKLGNSQGRMECKAGAVCVFRPQRMIILLARYRLKWGNEWFPLELE